MTFAEDPYGAVMADGVQPLTDLRGESFFDAGSRYFDFSIGKIVCACGPCGWTTQSYRKDAKKRSSEVAVDGKSRVLHFCRPAGRKRVRAIGPGNEDYIFGHQSLDSVRCLG